MKRLILFILLSSSISGCATPLIIENGNQSRIFTPCTSDDLCFRDGYQVAWDNWSPGRSRDYPVSYRANQYEYLSNKAEYILVPDSVTMERNQLGGAR